MLQIRRLLFHSAFQFHTGNRRIIRDDHCRLLPIEIVPFHSIPVFQQPITDLSVAVRMKLESPLPATVFSLFFHAGQVVEDPSLRTGHSKQVTVSLQSIWMSFSEA